MSQGAWACFMTGCGDQRHEQCGKKGLSEKAGGAQRMACGVGNTLWEMWALSWPLIDWCLSFTGGNAGS